jgi:uncharacterized coiled-coil DUF342 family protein
MNTPEIQNIDLIIRAFEVIIIFIVGTVGFFIRQSLVSLSNRLKDIDTMNKMQDDRIGALENKFATAKEVEKQRSELLERITAIEGNQRAHNQKLSELDKKVTSHEAGIETFYRDVLPQKLDALADQIISRVKELIDSRLK